MEEFGPPAAPVGHAHVPAAVPIAAPTGERLNAARFKKIGTRQPQSCSMRSSQASRAPIRLPFLAMLLTLGARHLACSPSKFCLD